MSKIQYIELETSSNH